MPSPQTAAFILFWFQVVSGIAAAIYIGQWMLHHAKRIGGGDMTSFPMKYPRLLLGLIGLSLCCGIFGLWNMSHLQKPVSCPASSTATLDSDTPGIQVFSDLIANQSPQDMMMLGSQYKETGEYAKDCYLLAKASTAYTDPNSEAMTELAQLCYLNGRGISADLAPEVRCKTAKYWLSKASERGNSRAPYETGTIYDHDNLCGKEDDVQACHWYQQSKKMGNSAPDAWLRSHPGCK